MYNPTAVAVASLLLTVTVAFGQFNSAATSGPTATPPTSNTRLVNMSTRLRVETGDAVLIGGFIVTGSEAKPLLVRAIGPSLAVDGALADPRLELYNAAGELVAFNDNWRDAPNARRDRGDHDRAVE